MSIGNPFPLIFATSIINFCPVIYRLWLNGGGK